MFTSPRAQRFVATSITALLASNAIVLVTGILGGDASPAPVVSDGGTVTYIQNPDGTQTLVDPTTPEGWQAIHDAEQRGDQVVTEPTAQAPGAVQAQKATTTTLLPGTGANGARSGISIPGVTIPDVDGVLTTVVSTVNGVLDTAEDTLDDVTGVVEDTTGLDLPPVTLPRVTTTTTAPGSTTTTIVEVPSTIPAVTVPEVIPGGAGGSTVVPSTPIPPVPPVPGLGS
jgi:hypothetical protein